METLTQVLLGALSLDAALRKQAEARLTKLAEQDFSEFLCSLSEEIHDKSKPFISRMLAGLVFKNSLQPAHRWLALDEAVKSQIKGSILRTLHDTGFRSASLAIVGIAAVEPWPELIGLLSSYIFTSATRIKKGVLNTIGFLCDEGVSLEDHAKYPVFTAILHCANSFEEDGNMIAAALRAFNSALDFSEIRFNLLEFNYIFRIVRESCASKILEVQQGAFESLVTLSFTCYEHLDPYIRVIFGMTTSAVLGEGDASVDASIAARAIDVWTSICRREVELKGGLGYVNQFLPELVSMLLYTIDKPSEIDDKDDRLEWMVAHSAGVCISWLTTLVQKEVLLYIGPYIEEKFHSGNNLAKESALFALGSMLEMEGHFEELYALCSQKMDQIEAIVRTQEILRIIFARGGGRVGVRGQGEAGGQGRREGQILLMKTASWLWGLIKQRFGNRGRSYSSISAAAA